MAAARLSRITFGGRSAREIRAARKWRRENLGTARLAAMDAELAHALLLFARFPGAGTLVPGTDGVRWWP